MEITAAVVHEPGADFRVETVDISEPRDSEVLVAIEAVGLCHTDLVLQQGHLPFPMPAVLGHEGAGVVTSVGNEVTKVAVGDRVALSFNSCGECTTCKDGAPSHCAAFMGLNFAGSRLDGTTPLTLDGKGIGSNFFGQSSFASHAIANERNVVKIDDDFAFELAAPLGCGVQTGAGAVMRSLNVSAGSSLLVLGGGSVGLSAVLAAVVREQSVIIVVEPVAKRRELALELGATHVIDPAAGVVAEQVRAILATGVDYVVDTTGNIGALEQAFGSLAPRGAIGLIGAPADPTTAFPVPILPLQILGATVSGIVEGDSNPDEFIPELIALYKNGKFPFDKLVTKMPFAEINEAVRTQTQGEAVKVVLVRD
jgi:aryl-alcohol dehydrogenase